VGERKGWSACGFSELFELIELVEVSKFGLFALFGLFELFGLFMLFGWEESKLCVQEGDIGVSFVLM
jgi:hypothetical protein